jgi:diguanylate cyclase (GGDEF)-like protein/PAS domain S-box-containing protein
MGTDPATEDPSPVEHMSEGDQQPQLVGSVRDYAILGLDVGGSVISWNAGAELIKGYRAEEIIGRHFSVFYPREDIDSGKPAAELVEATRLGRFEDEGWRLRKDGTRFWANVVITALFDDQGHLRGFGKVTRDITERRRSEEAFHEARAFQEALLVASPAIISLLDPATGSTVWASRSVLDLLGYEPAQIIEMGPEMVPLIIHPADVDGYLQANAQVARLDPGAALELRPRVQRFDGTQLWFLRRMTPFRHADGRALVLSVSTDITTQVEAEGALAYRALHDGLTGLPNRELLRDRLEQAVARVERGGLVAVLMIDLDGFKEINDRSGHSVGDQVLVAVADRLRSRVRLGDTVGRLGGDEFVVVLDGAEAAVAADDADDVCRRVIADLAPSFDVDGIDYLVTASIGVAFARSGNDLAGVLAAADAAMYRAKAAGKNTHVVSERPVVGRGQAPLG